MQGEWKDEEVGKKQQIVITSIPYGVNKGNLEAAIGEIIADRKLPQLLNLTNESNEKEGLRIALEMKAGTDPNVVMAYLYKHTALQENFAYNLTCLVPGAGRQAAQPERLGLRRSCATSSISASPRSAAASSTSWSSCASASTSSKASASSSTPWTRRSS